MPSPRVLPIVVIGAGPVGLVAAAHLAQRRMPFVVLEAGPTVGTAVRRWAHVRMFSPWRFDLDPLAVELLTAHGWKAPDPASYPTGGELVATFLEPLASLPMVRPALRFLHCVVAVARFGRDKLAGCDRAGRPFVVRVSTPEGEMELLARAVIDASGAVPNPLGASGLPALGEAMLAERIAYGMPDVLGIERPAYAGRRTLVVGAGHSAFGVLLDLVELARQEPGTEIHWAVRRRSLAGRLGSPNDELPERGRLGLRVAEAVAAGRIRLHTGITIERVERHPEGLVVWSGVRSLPPVDRIVCVTGYRPDLAPLRELRLTLDPVVEAPAALAPLIDPNVHSCGTVPPHGAVELAHPQEPDFFVVGLKSYGRAPTFLLRTGYEQVRSVVAALAGAWDEARRVHLELPATGVCGGSAGDECCSLTTPKRNPGVLAATRATERRARAVPIAASSCCEDGTSPLTGATGQRLQADASGPSACCAPPSE